MRYGKRGRTSRTISRLIVLSVVVASLSGYAPASAQTAEADSVETAFFTLKFDYEVLQARTQAQADSDSMKVDFITAQFQRMLDDERDKRKRDLILIGVSVIGAGLLLYAGGQISE